MSDNSNYWKIAKKRRKKEQIAKGMKSGDVEAYRDIDGNVKHRDTIKGLAKKQDKSPWRSKGRESYEQYALRSEDPTKKYYRKQDIFKRKDGTWYDKGKAMHGLWDAKKKNQKGKLDAKKKRKKIRNKSQRTQY